MCVYDSRGGAPVLVLSATALPGGDGLPCWRHIGDRVPTYKDWSAAANGLRVLRLKAGAAGTAKIVVEFQGAAIPMPAPLAQDPTVTMQVVNSRGTCWGAHYSSPAPVARPDRFKDLND